MDRFLQYRIPPEADGLRAEQYLSRMGYSRQVRITLKKFPDGLLLNGHPVYMTHPVHSGDLLNIHLQDVSSSAQVCPVRLPLDILYEDEDLLVVNKPAGMPTHPSMNHYTDTLANALAYYYASQNQTFVFRCCNRLDQDTSGLTIIAKNLLSSCILSRMAVRKEIRREYLGIVRGRPASPDGTISIPLGRKPGSVIERTADWEHGEAAVTHYHIEGFYGEYTLLRLVLETGRTHQIRIHLKGLGTPLIGDYLYNPDMERIRRQALHSCRLSFIHPIHGQKLDFSAPLPKDMEQVLHSS